MEEVCIPPPEAVPAAAAEEEVDSNIMTLPTLDVMMPSSAIPLAPGALLFCNPDRPVMDDAALGTVESAMSLPLPPEEVMGTIVAGGVLPVSAPNELSSEDMGSTSRLADELLLFAVFPAACLCCWLCSLDEDRVGCGGGDTVAG